MKASSSPQQPSYNLPVNPVSSTSSPKNICNASGNNWQINISTPTPPTPPNSPTISRAMRRNETERFIGSTTEYKQLYADSKKLPRRVSFSDNDQIKKIAPAQELEWLAIGYGLHTKEEPDSRDMNALSKIIYNITDDIDVFSQDNDNTKESSPVAEHNRYPQLSSETGRIWIEKLFAEHAASQR